MKSIVYADILFLMNFIINLIILKITCIFIKTSPSLHRIVLAALAGGIYAVCFFYPEAETLYTFPFKVIMSFIMIAITIPKLNFIKALKSCAVFYLTSFSLAGILLALAYFANFNEPSLLYKGSNILYFNISISTLLISSIVVYILLWLTGVVFTKNKMSGIRKLKIELNDNECILSALCDTGNLLTDPISNLPVIIADKKSISPLFPSGIPDITTGCTSGAKLRVIPYSSLGAKNEVMTGFVPDKVLFDGKAAEGVIIGISEDALSSTDEYNALFNPNILN